MQAWESVQNTLQWIEENLSQSIQVDQLATTAHLSSFYYQRLFSRLVGKPVMEYVKLRRLANAADYLAQHNARILDTALNFGFDSHETFTRSFKDAYGLTPEEYRAAPRPLSHYLMPDLSLQYYLVDENVPLATDAIVLEVSRTHLAAPREFIGFTLQNPMADTPGIDFLGELWTRLHQQKELIRHLVNGGNEAGISYPGEAAGCFSYFAGAEISEAEDQQGFVRKSLPAGEYILCSFEAENFYLLTTNALNKARDYMLGVWLARHQITIEPMMIEIYGDTAPDASKMEIWFKIKTE